MNNVVKNINVSKYPLVVISDVHASVLSVQRIRNKYPDNEIICLGDIADLWNKGATDSNKKVVNYFSENKIPTLMGNHDEWVAANQLLYQMSDEHVKYLMTLPCVFVLDFPDGKTYKCYHYKPTDFWGMDNTNMSYLDFCSTYGDADSNDGILIGHTHTNFIRNFKNARRKFIGIGSLKYGDYALLTENGIEFKKL